MASPEYTEVDKKEDMKVLHGMGYAQELSRSMSRFSNFAISFSIICILSGGINSFAQATSSIGGAGAGIGWIVGCMVSGFFALAMAQIASAYPTAGGLYHWASILGNRFTGWLTAWLNLLGLITVLGAINIGTAFFFVGTFGGSFGFTGTAGQIVGIVAFITVLQALFNHFGIKLTAMLTDASGFLILGATIVLIVACLVFAPAIDITRLWTFTNFSGEAGGNVFPQSDSMGYLFLLCLLLPIYTITGYDASAHTSEETLKAAHSVPRAIVSSVLWSSLIGWVMLCAIVLAIPDLTVGASQGWGVFFATMDAIMPGWLKTLLYLAILIAQFLCGLATVTSASRMLFAFSRDGGMPVGSAALAKVSPQPTARRSTQSGRLRSSRYSMCFLPSSSRSAARTSTPSSSTPRWCSCSSPSPSRSCLACSPTAPRNGRSPVRGISAQACSSWSACCRSSAWRSSSSSPSSRRTTRCCGITIGFLVLTAVLWFGFENRRFQGPPIGEEIAKRQAAIKAAEQAVGETGH